MEITKEMLIAEFARQIDFANFMESNHTAPFRKAFLEYALTLIRELTEENERLRAERDTLDILVKDLKFRLVEAMKANQTWEEENKDLECDNDMLRERITEIRADTVRGVQKRLIEYYSSSIYRPTQKHPTKHTMIEHLFYVIDQIAEEMIGETK